MQPSLQFKQLTAFHAVASCQSFSEATRMTGLSQPTLSRLIKQLEEELETELLDRYHRPLQLTEAGKFFFHNTQAMLTEFETVINITKRIATPKKSLSIGFVPSVLYGLLPDIISRLKNTLPNLEIQLKDISSYQQVNALKSGDIDVGFGRFTIAPRQPLDEATSQRQTIHSKHHVKQILLRHERYVVALPKSHPLANTPNQHLRQHAESHLILYHQTYLPLSTASSSIPQANSIREPLLHLFSRQGIQPYSTSTVSDLQVALGLVAAGEGITLVPDSLKSVRTEQIAYQRLIHENATSPIYLNILEDLTHSALPTLLDAIYEIYEEKGITYRRYQP
ncbi:LysR substrate-binding domain-containing protein [Psychrobacter sp. I-STPA6b]|uniref:LysR substrate-binding domain-containing protein n=1 Tax=Psychrobacter sp. I-STPA6b TaxID=2585718 RepID=UPI001D0CDC5A|nr:LysR substrate-binding domain-containing protein [Psychrobacter sp. I-STPA6b]